MTPKAQRHAAILRLVKGRRIHSQQRLKTLLVAEEIDVTQATLSRDIRVLGLIKVADPDGGSFYTVPADREVPHPSLEQLLPALLLSLDGVGPLLVARTPQGSAEALGGALDGAEWDAVIGTIAGDDTLLIITKSEGDRQKVAGRLDRLAHR